MSVSPTGRSPTLPINFQNTPVLSYELAKVRAAFAGRPLVFKPKLTALACASVWGYLEPMPIVAWYRGQQ